MKQRNIAMAIIFSFLTCGIYSLVWMYKLGDEVEDAGGKNEGVVYLILSLFGFMLISVALAQHQVNKICQKNQN